MGEIRADGPVKITRLDLRTTLRYDAASGIQTGCVGMACREAQGTTETQSKSLSKSQSESETRYADDAASGQGVAGSICHMAVYALMATGALRAAGAAKPTAQKHVCCSAIPNQCRGWKNVTCVEDDGISGYCIKSSCLAIQYWVKEVSSHLNPSQAYTAFGGNCHGSWCTGTVCRTANNTFQ